MGRPTREESEARASARARVVELLASGELKGVEIAAQLDVTTSYVSNVRKAEGLSDGDIGRADTTGRSISLMAPPEPEDAPTRRERKVLAGRIVPDGRVRPGVVVLDGAESTVGPGTEGRALITMHERGAGTVVARANRAQMTALIETYTAARDALPEGT